MKTKKLLSLFMFLAAIICFGFCLWLKRTKAAIDITEGSLSEKVDQRMAIQVNIYLCFGIGIIFLLGCFILLRLRKISN